MHPEFSVRHRCPACGTAESRELLRIPYADPVLVAAMERLYDDVGHYETDRCIGASFVLHECSSCKLIYQQEIPQGGLLSSVYGDWHDDEKDAQQWRRNLHLARRAEIAREVAVALRLVDGGEEKPRILDYGCGMGQWGSMAIAFGAEAWGGEFSPARQAISSALGIRMLDDAELPRSFFDYIHLDQVLEHVAEPKDLLERLRETLRPGGVICVAVPQGARVPHFIKHWRREFRRKDFGQLVGVVPLLHLNCFNHQNLRQLASTVGLVHQRPSWKELAPLWAWPDGTWARLRAMLRPLYLRSGRSTRLFFRRPVVS